MLTRIEVKKTYWLGMSYEQKQALIHLLCGLDDSDFFRIAKEIHDSPNTQNITHSDIQLVVADLRQALLNI